MPAAARFLAIDTSTDTLSIALGSGAPGNTAWTYTGPGAAQASLHLLPQVEQLLATSGWALRDLDAIVFGRGPGAFTGLRTACSVTQGLAYGSRSDRHPQGLPVLPVDSLLALAEAARAAHLSEGRPMPRQIVALLDARMNEMYVAVYALAGERLHETSAPRLCAPADLVDWLAAGGWHGKDTLLAGNVFEVYREALRGLSAEHRVALPSAEAMLRLAPSLLAAGAAVAAQDALPLYVRDKVARTTAEREGRA